MVGNRIENSVDPIIMEYPSAQRVCIMHKASCTRTLYDGRWIEQQRIVGPHRLSAAAYRIHLQSHVRMFVSY